MGADNYFKGFVAALSGLMEVLLPPVLTMLCLLASALVLGGRFDAPYVILAFLSALLAYIFISRRAGELVSSTEDVFTIARRILFAWALCVGILLLVGFMTKYTAHFSRRVLTLWIISTPAAIILGLYIGRVFVVRHFLGSGSRRTAIIVGVNKSSRRLARNIKQLPGLGIQLLAFFDNRRDERVEGTEAPVLGSLGEAVDYVRRHRVDMVFIALPLSNVKPVLKITEGLQDTTACVYFVPDIFVSDLIQSRPRDIRGVPVISLYETPFNGPSFLVKRLMDIVGSAILLAILSPLMLFVSFLVKRSSPGPVFFKQRRYGMDGKEIKVWKFRTMTVMEDGDTVVQAKKDDSRVTPVGRFLRQYSIDELPQLFNVLFGEMSLVGPRPHAVAHNEMYRKLIKGYMVRHKAIPGITGLAQVRGLRGETKDLAAMESRVRYDLEYMRNWTPMLDIKILIRTLAVVLKDTKNAY